jgi:hypothetical protein
VGVLAVMQRDDRVSIAPDDQGRHPLVKVVPVAGVDTLAARVDYPAERGEKGHATIPVGERCIAACYL